MRLFERDDFEVIAEWFVLRGMRSPRPEDIPAVGFIEDFTAAGFLVQTDSSSCVLDFFITNPEAEPRLRNRALDDITRCCLQYAKRQGYRRAMCHTQIATIEKRAKRLGFGELGNFRFLSMELT